MRLRHELRPQSIHGLFGWTNLPCLTEKSYHSTQTVVLQNVFKYYEKRARFRTSQDSKLFICCPTKNFMHALRSHLVPRLSLVLQMANTVKPHLVNTVTCFLARPNGHTFSYEKTLTVTFCTPNQYNLLSFHPVNTATCINLGNSNALDMPILVHSFTDQINGLIYKYFFSFLIQSEKRKHLLDQSIM